MSIKRHFRLPLAVSLVFLATISAAQAQYSGGSGTADDPYQIATAADLIALGETPEDYDKHFILTTDIDLDPNLPGRRVFDRAVIGPDTNPGTPILFEGSQFTGVFDGTTHTISNLTVDGGAFLGLFGVLGNGAVVSDLGLVNIEIAGSGISYGRWGPDGEGQKDDLLSVMRTGEDEWIIKTLDYGKARFHRHTGKGSTWYKLLLMPFQVTYLAASDILYFPYKLGVSLLKTQ